MNNKEFEELINNSKESRNVEFKKSSTFESIQFKIVKTSLALSNLEDGGFIIIGIEEIKNTYNREGISETDLASYTQDKVQSLVNSFAEPHINLELHLVELNAKKFLIIQISSFSSIPTICIKDGSENLRKGGIYIRSSRMPESSEIRSYSEMRELIDLATERSMMQFLQKTQRIGLSTSVQQSNQNFYDHELNGI